MKLSIDKNRLIQFTSTQLDHFYPDNESVQDDLKAIFSHVIERMFNCFSNIHKKYYVDNGEPCFNHLNSDHYAMYLYWVSNEAYQKGKIHLAEKAFLLNKALHGIDAFYSITLPETFLFVHPVGTVLGNAHYSNFLVIYQNVTVGSDVGGEYPKFGQSVVLYSKSTVIGACSIGDNVSFGSHALARNINIPDHSLVFGSCPNVTIKSNHRNNFLDFFGKGSCL